MLLRIAFHYTYSLPDAEDVVQEVFLRFFSGKGRVAWDDAEAVKAWLIRMTINRCRDALRTARRRGTEPLTESAAVTGPPGEGSLLGAVLQLPEKYRAVIYLHYYEGYAFREIAGLLHIKEKTIHTWHSRAKKLLKEMLAGDGETRLPLQERRGSHGLG